MPVQVHFNSSKVETRCRELKNMYSNSGIQINQAPQRTYREGYRSELNKETTKFNNRLDFRTSKFWEENWGIEACDRRSYNGLSSRMLENHKVYFGED